MLERDRGKIGAGGLNGVRMEEWGRGENMGMDNYH